MIDWGQKEKPTPKRRVQEVRSFGTPTHSPARLTVKRARTVGTNYCKNSLFALAAEILMTPLLNLLVI